MQGYFVSADAIQANEVLFAGETVPDSEDQPVQKRAFCQSCTFLTSGAWGARVDYTDQNQQAVTEDVQLGWWIAGDVVDSSDMPTTGNATYAGDAIGNVASLGEDGWATYVATGDMDMTWNFGHRSGVLTISDFDGKTFGGRWWPPERSTFFGPLIGSGVVGEANGAFVGSPGPGQKPDGVIGNFGVGNASWQATGIFGGTRQ